MFDFNIIIILIFFAIMAGFFAGLLGAGGGMIIVPALFFAFKFTGYSDDILMHLAVGTSLAIIFPTSIISAYTHFKLGNLDKNFFIYCSFFIFFGIILGAIFTTSVNTKNLLILFSVFTFMSAIFILLAKERRNQKRNIPIILKSIFGLITGFLSIPLGIGGASIMVTIMRFYDYSIRKAIGTSAHFGIIISFFGFISLLVSGYFFSNIEEPYSIGYINILGFLIFTPITILLAPIGAKFSSKIKKKLLDKIFGIVLMIISLRSFYEIFDFI